MPSAKELSAHNVEFEKGIVQLSANAFLAVGYAASNVGFLVAPSGVVVIDSTESTESAREILTDFRKLCALPILAVVLTHGHRDHIGGISIFVDERTPIIAHETFHSHLGSSGPSPARLNMIRTRRQFGAGLAPHTERINIGIGPAILPEAGLGSGFRPPTRLIRGASEQIEIGGLTLALVAAPGETPDHMLVWSERDEILFCGDNYYCSFPNLYAIRGTPYRDFSLWAASLDTMANLNASILAPGHTRPIFGKETVRETLLAYHDAIQFVIDKTIEGMNLELSLDELVGYVKLPAPLASKPFLQEYYGTVEFAVRAFYSGTMGWFDGNPTHLRGLTAVERATRFVDLCGGQAQLVEAMHASLRRQDYRWSMELADHLLALSPDHEDARQAKRSALLVLAADEGNAPVRNYYLASARELAQT